MHESKEPSRHQEWTVERRFFATEGEEHLLLRALSGDTAAFDHLVMPHRDAILRLTQRILRNREDAEDAVQNALLDAFCHLDAFQGRAQFSSWLTRIALNAAFMRLRTSRRRNETSLEKTCEQEPAAEFHVIESRHNPEQAYSAKELRGLLNRALLCLGPLDTAVLHLRDVQELSAREAAQILGVTERTVKSRLHRARMRLTGHASAMLAHRTTPRSPRNTAGIAFQTSKPVRA